MKQVQWNEAIAIKWAKDEELQKNLDKAQEMLDKAKGFEDFARAREFHEQACFEIVQHEAWYSDLGN